MNSKKGDYMKNKKILALATILALGTPLIACGNSSENKAEENKAEVTEPANETSKDDTSKEEATNEEATNEEATNEEAKDGGKEDSENGKKPLKEIETTYLPEDFLESFSDKKKDLITTEYTAKNNPAKKITVQISDNDQRIGELIKMPEDAEDVKVGEETGKYWEDEAFNYLSTKKGDITIYTRSNIDKEEVIKVVEGIK